MDVLDILAVEELDDHVVRLGGHRVVLVRLQLLDRRHAAGLRDVRGWKECESERASERARKGRGRASERARKGEGKRASEREREEGEGREKDRRGEKRPWQGLAIFVTADDGTLGVQHGGKKRVPNRFCSTPLNRTLPALRMFCSASRAICVALRSCVSSMSHSGLMVPWLTRNLEARAALPAVSKGRGRKGAGRGAEGGEGRGKGRKDKGWFAYRICSGVPPIVALAIAHVASLRTRSSLVTLMA